MRLGETKKYNKSVIWTNERWKKKEEKEEVDDDEEGR